MESGIRRYRFCFIDYIWYVAENNRETGSPTSGGQMLFLCWIFAVVIPLGMPVAFHFLGRIAALMIALALCLVPDLFCKFRYTAGRREALREHYKGLKHFVRKQGLILLASFVLAGANIALMFHLGFMHWSR